MDKNEILIKAYKKMKLDFKIDDKRHIYIKSFDINYFRNNIKISMDETIILNIGYSESENEYINIVNKGRHIYEYNNIYEVLLWYYYYKTKYKHIEHKNKNRSYFARIPEHYKKTKKGLKIVKDVLDEIIIKNKGVPKYYNESVINNLMIIK
jgi:hypothetical protein